MCFYLNYTILKWFKSLSKLKLPWEFSIFPWGFGCPIGVLTFSRGDFLPYFFSGRKSPWNFNILTFFYYTNMLFKHKYTTLPYYYGFKLCFKKFPYFSWEFFPTKIIWENPMGIFLPWNYMGESGGDFLPWNYMG